MTLVMAYATLLGCCAVAVGGALYRGLGPRHAQRWIWFSALVAASGATLVALIAPKSDSSTLVAAAMLPRPVPTSSATRGPDWLMVLDRTASITWGIASGVLLVTMATCALRLRSARRRAARIQIREASVLLTDDIGPAVAGFSRPDVLMPAWVLSLDESLQQLLLVHEDEHARAGDVRLLWFASFIVALFPWNPAVWWLTRRLRLAVELDCDRRVLARSANVRDYAELLLVAAHRRAASTPLNVPQLRGATSDLRTRIDAMTMPQQQPSRAQRVLWGTLGGAAILLACESPRPDPVAPIRVAAPQVTDSSTRGSIVREIPVSEAASHEYVELRKSIDSLRLVASKLRAAIADEHAHFTEVERRIPLETLPETPPTAFRAGDAKLLLGQPDVEIPATQLVIVDSDGKELYAHRLPDAGSRKEVRLTGKMVLDGVRPEHIKEMEVVKASRCEWGGRVSEPCGLIRMQLMPGVKLSELTVKRR